MLKSDEEDSTQDLFPVDEARMGKVSQRFAALLRSKTSPDPPVTSSEASSSAGTRATSAKSWTSSRDTKKEYVSHKPIYKLISFNFLGRGKVKI